MSPVTTLSPQQLRVLPWLVAMAFFMQTLDTTILNTALPSVAASLDANPLQMQGVIISYTITVALLIPASGWLADRFGTRRVFLAAIMLFCLGSLACALSFSFKQLVAARVLQGSGGALLAPVGRLSILQAFPRNRLVQVLSFITIPALVGPLIGPTLGGFLVDYASWHWIFLINLPIGLIGIFATMRYMPHFGAAETPYRFDWPGFLLFGTAMVAMTLAFVGIGDFNFAYTSMAVLFLFGLICLAVYCLHALRAPHPLFSPGMFRTRNFTVGILGNLFARLGTGAMPFLTPLLLQVGLGYAPRHAGLMLIPMTLAAMAAKGLVRVLLNRFGYKLVLCCNTLVLGVLMGVFSCITPETPLACILILFTVFGCANSIQFTAMNTLTLIDIADTHASSGNGLLSTVMQISMSMGVACAAAILGEFTGGDQAAVGPGVLDAFHKTYLCVGAMTMLSTLIFFQVRDTRPQECLKGRNCDASPPPQDGP